jgi:hypothetical protein
MTCPHAPSGCNYPEAECAGLCAVTYWQGKARLLVAAAEAQGVIVTVERHALRPLAMGNHIALVEARPKRGFLRMPADDTEGGAA